MHIHYVVVAPTTSLDDEESLELTHGQIPQAPQSNVLAVTHLTLNSGLILDYNRNI